MKPAAWALTVLVLTGGRLPSMSPTPFQAASPPGALLPADFLGYKAEPPDQTYEGEGIFDYIDGAGEVYRAYNYKSVIVRRYKKPAAAEITVDLFDMGSPKDAFGVFTHDLEGEPWSIGQGSLYKSGLLQFWRGRYFVSIYAENEAAETKAAVSELGTRIAAAVGADGPRPDLLDRLPDDFRGAGPVRYLHSPVILNYHFFVSRENLLRLDGTTEAVLAAKGEKGARRYLLLVRYPTPEKAREAERGFLAGYIPDAQTAGARRVEGLVRTEDGRWTAAFKENAYVVVVFNAATEAEAEAAREAALSKLRRT